MKKIFLLLVAVAAVNCVHALPDQLDRWHKSISVETEPAGQRIFFAIAKNETNAIANRSYVGLSPCAVIVKIDSDGRFQNDISGLVHPVAVFMAEPSAIATNLFPQKQIFQVPAAFHHTGKAPDAVFFDMRKAP